jgi:hypothetical protein
LSEPTQFPSTAVEASVVTVPISLIGGGAFRFGGTPLEAGLARAIVDTEMRPGDRPAISEEAAE